MNLSAEKKIMNLENRLVIAKRKVNGMDWELGVNRCIVMPLEWISNEILLCSPGKYVWSIMMEHDNVRNNNVYMYM